MNSLNDKSYSNSRMLDATQDFSVDFTKPHKRSRISSGHENSPSCATMPRKSLNDLPDLCLLLVFKRISLIELFRNVRLVNTRLSQLVPTELKRRRSLVIVDDRIFELSDLQLDQHQSGLIEHVRRNDGLTPWSRLPPIDYMNLVDRSNRYTENNPLHNQVQPEMITTLVDNLPRIRSLTVVQRFFDLSALDQIARMIDHWRGQLVSLKIYLYHEYTFEMEYGRLPNGVRPDEHKAQLNARTVALFDSVNRAASLKHLKLELDNFSYYNDQFTRPPLTILSQLSTFHSNTFKDNFGDELVRYASGNRDLKIASNGSTLKCLLGINHEFRDKFVYVKIDNSYNCRADDLKLFCTRFTSLVHLSITDQHCMPVTKLARCLTSLTQLVHLSLLVYAHEKSNELPSDQIIPLASVRLLSIILLIRSHKTEQLHLPELFSNVEVLDLEIQTWSCTDCGYYLVMDIVPNDRHQKCAQLARRSFRSFPRLHTVQIDSNDSHMLSSYDKLEKRFIAIDQL